MKIHQMEQQSPEWFEVRKGKMTASHAQPIGNIGKGLDTYILEIMSKANSSGEEEGFTNKDMERGVELEPMAREMYELENDCKIQEVGFIERDEYVGCSPDGLIGEKGGVEIKSPKDINHFKMILNGEKEIESKYIWQIQMNLLITGREWWDFVSYNPNFKRSLLVYRIYPDEKKLEKLREGLELGIKKIKEIKELIK